jgi:two-component system chemotaxis sensor kinase CheA
VEERIRNFLAEAVDLIDSAYESIKLLKSGSADGSMPVNSVNEMFRIFHTIKGLAGMNNFQNLASFTHSVENLLDFLRRSGNNKSISKIADILFASLDVFEDYFEEIRNSGSDKAIPIGQEDVVNELDLLIKQLQQQQQNDSEDILNSISPKLVNQLNDLEISRLKSNIREGKSIFTVDLALDFESFDVDLKKIHKQLDEQGELMATLPGPDVADEEKISFTLLFACADESCAKNIFPRNPVNVVFCKQSVNANDNDEADTVVNTQTESSLDISDIKTQPVSTDKEKNNLADKGKDKNEDSQQKPVHTTSSGESLRIFVDDIDKIVSGLEDFTVVKNNFEEELKNLQLTEGENAVVERLKLYAGKLGDHISAFQKQIIGLRMIPLGNIFRRIESAIVRTAKSLGKDVRIVFKGGDTAVDKPITDKLIEPLIHILRNSVDHGIEKPEERLKVGKDPIGTIVFNAYQQGNSVFIEISDDGKGIDTDVVIKKALSKGLIKSSQEFTTQEAVDLIFLPGFSTAEEISDISGRGVGMDIVKSTINSIGGSIVVDTSKGRGTKVLVQIPVTQAVVSLFLIKSGKFLLGIPSFYVSTVEKFEKGKSKYVHNRMYYRFGNKTIPIVNISLLLGTVDLDTDSSIILLVKHLGQDYGLLVEDILEEKEVTVKPLSGKLKNLPLISGICEFSNKSLIYVIDIGDLIETTGVKYV